MPLFATPPPPPPPAIRTAENPPATPEWAKDAVWYQIFPERFRNGAPQSDPRPEDFADRSIPGWRIRPWGMEWYARDAWETAKSPRFWDTVFDRRLGGDLVGVREKLPYLRDLGVTAIYLNPVFRAPSLHKYDATCYHHIDPTLGPDRAGDLAALSAAAETEDPSTWIWTRADLFFLGLLRDAHALGIRVIIDGVFNHTGRTCFAFRDILARGAESPYLGWYQVTRFRPDGPPDYAAWDGPNGSLPAFARSPDGDDLAAPVKKYLFDITRRWMRPDPPPGAPRDGIDGWRLDVYTTAEIVGPAQDWVRPGEFSAAMNYEWLFPTLSFFTPHPQALTATGFRAAIDRLHARHDPGTTLILQNLLDSHDTGRILTMLHSACPPFANWDNYFRWARVADNAQLRTDAPSPDALARLRLATVWQFTSPGAPMIYYGDELGLWGANDPCDRQPMPWPDIPLAPETLGFRAPLPVSHPRAPDQTLLAHYRALTALRARHPALRRGTFRWIETSTETSIAYERALGPDRVLVCLNKGPAPLPPPPGFPPDTPIPSLGWSIVTPLEFSNGREKVEP